MLDIFKGAAVTAITWTLAYFYVSRFPAGFIWALPSASFLLQLLLPNRRWLLGSAAFCVGAIALLVKSADGSLGAALGIAMLLWVAVGTVLGITVRFAIRRARASYGKLTHTPPLPVRELPPISRRSVKLTAYAVAALLAMYSLFVMHSARVSAQQIAAGRSYCVQVASGNNYRSVTSRLDLLGFRMMGDGPPHHAVLMVKSGSALEMYHWSYFHNAFVQSDYVERPIYCDLVPDFLAHPHRYRQEAKNSLSFLLKGHSFSIPKTYAPAVYTTGHIDIEVPRLNSIDITLGRDGILEAWRTKPDSERRVESLGKEHELTKERVREANSKYTPFLQFYELDSLGQVKTLVLCEETAQSNCTHIFSDGRLSYFFHHPLSEVSHWQQMQRTLSAMTETFIDQP